jgi:hypothetical protein
MRRSTGCAHSRPARHFFLAESHPKMANRKLTPVLCPAPASYPLYPTENKPHLAGAAATAIGLALTQLSRDDLSPRGAGVPMRFEGSGKFMLRAPCLPRRDRAGHTRERLRERLNDPWWRLRQRYEEESRTSTQRQVPCDKTGPCGSSRCHRPIGSGAHSDSPHQG